MCDKKRIEQHRIESESILIFQESLPRSSEKDFLFTKLPDDYGVDGLIQVFENGIHIGEIYYVQIKGKENFNYKISMKITDVEFLVNKLSEIIVLIIVDTKNRNVYWHDVQTNDILKKHLKAKKINQKSITINVDNNKTIPQNFDDFYSYLKSLRQIRVEKGLIKILENQSIIKSISYLESIKKKTTEINGYKWKKDNGVSKYTVLSVYNQGEGELINLEAVDELNEDNAINVNMKFIFPKTVEGLNKKEELDNYFKGLIDNVNIKDEFIENFVVRTKGKIIHQHDKSEKSSIELQPVKIFKKFILSINEFNIEMLFDVETYYSKNEGIFKIESAFYSKNAIRMKMGINPLTGESIFKLTIEKSLVTDFNVLLQFIILKKNDFNFDLFVINDNLKIKVGNWTSIKDSDTSHNLFKDILEKIIFIQEKAKVHFKYKDLNVEDFKNINLAYDLLLSGEAHLDINLKFDSKIEVQEGHFLKIAANDFHLLGEVIKFENKKIEMIGKIEKIVDKKWVQDDIYNYKCNIPDMRIKLET